MKKNRAKYEDLVNQCRRQGWRAQCEPIEVSCRGFAGQPLCRATSLLRVTGVDKRKATRNTVEAAEKALRWLWINKILI